MTAVPAVPAGHGTPTAAGDRSAASRWAWPIGIHAGIGAVLWVTAWWASQNLLRVDSYVRAVPTVGGAWTEGWLRWDGPWYLDVARSGYSYHEGVPSNVVFLPAYPMLTRAVGWVVGDLLVAGLLVAVIAGLLATAGLWSWLGTTGLSAVARRTSLLVVLTWPWAFHLYGTVYAESLFLAGAVWAFVLLERDRVAWAALAGAVASGTRPIGAAVGVGLVLRLVERRGGLKRLRRSDIVVLGAFSGIGAYCAYVWVRFGDPLTFLSAQSAPGWEQDLSVRNALKLRLWEDIASGSQELPVRLLLVVGVLTVGAVALLPSVWRRFGPGYGSYTAIVVLMPALGSKDFQGMGRYLILAFPLFVVVGESLARRRELVRRALVGGSFAVLVSFTALFATGHYVS